ncbi:hypothetical protein Cgig2_023127 [Carnegiea gigantea]|uniref:Uncharacterized protein n=1 Tax=Carnegiea gigantea TaxID=171969 RepID=A0A9Q1JRN9_9CARY|nr:hypothetical protein Cgig2_023127 [Carnegiea gigantea]
MLLLKVFNQTQPSKVEEVKDFKQSMPKLIIRIISIFMIVKSIPCAAWRHIIVIYNFGTMCFKNKRCLYFKIYSEKISVTFSMAYNLFDHLNNFQEALLRILRVKYSARILLDPDNLGISKHDTRNPRAHRTFVHFFDNHEFFDAYLKMEAVVLKHYQHRTPMNYTPLTFNLGIPLSLERRIPTTISFPIKGTHIISNLPT